MQSINSLKTYAYGISKYVSRDLRDKKEEIKYNNTIKQCKKWLTLMMLQKKKKSIIIQIGCKFLIIHTEY